MIQIKCRKKIGIHKKKREKRKEKKKREEKKKIKSEKGDNLKKKPKIQQTGFSEM